jgi:hypothetical protein
VAGCCECGDEPAVSGATELVGGVLYPFSERRKSVVFPHEPLLKLGVPWVKQKLQNTDLALA